MMVPPQVIAAGGNLISKFGATAFDHIMNSRNARKEREHDFELAEYQYQKDQDMWNKMNEYNTPKAQMARFGEAGLNPHLIYGKGTSGTANQMPQYQRSRTDYPRYKTDELFNYAEYQDIQMRDAQIQGELLKNKILGTNVKLLDDKEVYQRSAWSEGIKKMRSEITKNAATTGMTVEQTNKLIKWLEAWQQGINLDRDSFMDRELKKTLDMLELDGAAGAMPIIKMIMSIFR